MRKIRVSGKHIGEEEPCFIIAEASSNHNGSLEQAKKLVVFQDRLKLQESTLRVQINC